MSANANTYNSPVAGDERECEGHDGADDEHGVEDSEHGEDVAEGRLEIDVPGPGDRAANETSQSFTVTLLIAFSLLKATTRAFIKNLLS